MSDSTKKPLKEVVVKKQADKSPFSRGDEGDLPPHISVSQVNRFVACPLQYQYAYIDQIKSKPSFTLDLGKAVHESLEVNTNHKIEKGFDMPTPEVVEAYYESLSELGGMTRDFFSANELADYNQQKKKEEEMGSNLVRLYRNYVSPEINPLFAEKRFEIDLGQNTRPLVGLIDLVERDGSFADTKTSGRKYTQARTDSDIQLTTYFGALQSMGINPKKARFDILLKKKTPELQQLTTTRTTEDVEEAQKLIRGVDEEIKFSYKRGYFRPHPDLMVCSWCGYGPQGLNLCKAGKPFKKQPKKK